MRWSSCLFRPTRNSSATSLEVNPEACPAELQEQLATRGTACLRPRGATILYERVDDAGQGAFTPPVLIYIKRLPISSGLEVCVKRTLVTHFVGRAAREARLQVQLQHPHLLPALASVRGRHHYYLVLPAAENDMWVEAEALRQAGRGYSEDELRVVARQMLLGLEHLHANHLAHRDIKPANLLRMPDGRVVVADFGCADACSAGFVAAGTTQFQPPECRRSAGAKLAVLPKGYDQRSQDMWGVGATLASLWFAQMPQIVRNGAAGGGGGTAGGGGVGGGGSGSGGRGGGRSSSTGSGYGGGEEAGVSVGGASSTGTMHKVQSSGAVDRLGSSSAGNMDPIAGSGASLGPVSAAATAPTSEDGQHGTAGGSGGCAAAGTAATGGPPGLPPLPIPRFLAAAGFAFVASTVGACGAAMSPEFLDLLSSLLRLRPTDRLTAAAALQHPWMMAAPPVADTANDPLALAGPLPSAMAEAEPGTGASAPAGSSPASPLKRLLRASVDGRLSQFMSHVNLLHRVVHSLAHAEHADQGPGSERGTSWLRLHHQAGPGQHSHAGALPGTHAQPDARALPPPHPQPEADAEGGASRAEPHRQQRQHSKQQHEYGERNGRWWFRQQSHDGSCHAQAIAAAPSELQHQHLEQHLQHPPPAPQQRMHGRIASPDRQPPQPHAQAGPWGQHPQPISHAQSQHHSQQDKQGGRMTLRVFVGAGADNAGSH